MSDPRRRRVPQRTCVGCRQVRPKREMIRIVRTPEGEVRIDETGKAAGRGAYLCLAQVCWESGLAKGRLERALKVTMTSEDRIALQEFSQALARDTHGQAAKEIEKG
ncbi:MAG: RNase P modulator RnpM [Anaerolineae bacterium]